MLTRGLIASLFSLAFAAAALAGEGAAPVWHEGEDLAYSSVPTYAIRIVGDKPSASGGSALFGTALNVKDDTLRYDVELPKPIAAARLVFRYGRQHYKPGMVPAKIAVEITTAEKQKITREITFEATPGWGNNPTDWSLAFLDDLGDLPAGKTSLQLTATADESDITLDGFFFAAKSFTVAKEEFAALLQMQITSEGYAGLKLASHLVDQKNAKTLLVLARNFSGDARNVSATLLSSTSTTNLTRESPAKSEGASGATLHAFTIPPNTPDGEYSLCIRAAEPAITIVIPIMLVGDLLSTLDGRTAKLEAFAKKLSLMDDTDQAPGKALLPEFDHIIGFLKDKSAQLKHCVAAPDDESLRWVAAIKGYPKDPMVWAANAGRAVAQAEETVARLEKQQSPYAGRTGDFRRVYVLKAMKGPIIFRLLVPDGYAAADKVPMMLMLHGSGGDADSMPGGDGGKTVFEQANRRGYLVVSPAWPYTRAQQEETPAAEVLAELIAQVRKEYPKIDGNRIYCTGASAGGWGTCELAGTHPELLAAICCAIGPGTIAQVGKFHIPELIIQGSADSIIKPADTAKIVARMIELGLPIEVKMIPQCGHEYLSEPFMKMTLDFFDQHAKTSAK